MKTFKHASDFVKTLIEAHESGEPVNPNACRGGCFNTPFVIKDNASVIKNPITAITGNIINATSSAVFASSVNKVLENGDSVNADNVRVTGTFISTTILTGEGNDPKTKIQTKVEEPAVDTSEVEEPEVDTGDTDADDVSESVPSDEVEAGGEESAEVPAAPETEELSESSESKSDSSGDSGESVDWDYAKSIIDSAANKTDAKKELETYARKFGVELDRSRKFENMLSTFEAEISKVDENEPEG